PARWRKSTRPRARPVPPLPRRLLETLFSSRGGVSRSPPTTGVSCARCASPPTKPRSPWNDQGVTKNEKRETGNAVGLVRLCGAALFRFAFRGLRFLRGLRRDASGCGSWGGRVAEVVMANRREVVVELVDQRNARRDVQFDDVVVGNSVKVFH